LARFWVTAATIFHITHVGQELHNIASGEGKTGSRSHGMERNESDNPYRLGVFNLKSIKAKTEHLLHFIKENVLAYSRRNRHRSIPWGYLEHIDNKH
jgi:hypothetical protein